MKRFSHFFSRLLVLGLVSSNLSGFATAVTTNENAVQDSEIITATDSTKDSSSLESDSPDTTDTSATPTETPDIPAVTPEPEPSATTEVQPVAEPESPTIPLQLLGINDFHGALSTTGTATIEGTAYRNAGKAALLASYLTNAENAFDGQTIRVQAGDMVGASPANSGLLQDEPTIKALNRMNFEVGTLGNHEFDEGLGEFNRILTGAAPLPGEFNSITESYPREASKQEIVIANMVNKSDGAIPYSWKPYTVKDVTANGQTVKVGFIGIVTTEIPNLVLKKHYENYDFLDEATTITKYAKELREGGVNAIVVLAHVPSISQSQVVSGEAADIMTKVNQQDPANSIDAFFAGHNHQYTNGVVGSTRIVQSTSQGKAFINLTGELNPETQDFVATPDSEVTPVLANDSITPDAEVTAIVNEANDLVQTVTNEKIGTAATAETITRDINDAKESAVGNLVTDGQRELAKDQGFNVDFAMTNNGGIRADLLVNSDRSITWGAAQNVQPFGNLLQVVSMTGAQIEQVLNEQYDEEGKYFLQLSGLTYNYTDSGDATQPYKVHQVRKQNGELLDPAATYSVVINDFLFGGGDGFKTFTKATLQGAIDPDTETFINYIKKQENAGKLIDAKVEGRKTYISAAEIEATAIAAIKAATSLPEIREGVTSYTGKTIPNGLVAVQLNNVKTRATILVSGPANEAGDFTLDLQSLHLTKDQSVLITITDLNGYSAEFEQTVLAKATVEEQPEKEPEGIPSITPPIVINPTEKPAGSSTNPNSSSAFPQTGEQELALASIGLLLFGLGSGTIYLIRKRKIA